jgi:HAD superfamily hydrolase (TIGR01490 family)
MMKRLSVWDLDGTLLGGDSHALLLADLLLRSPVTASGRARIVLGALAWALRIADDDATKHMAAHAMAGWSSADLRAWIDRWALRRVLPRVRPGMAARLAADRAAGHVTLLMSASLDVPVAVVGRALGFDHVAGTRLAFDGDRVAPRIDGEALRGEAKARHLERFAREHGADLGHSRGYGDRASDRHFLGLVGEPFAVRPDRGLRRVARARGWTIVDEV